MGFNFHILPILLFIIKFCAAQNRIHALWHRKSYFNSIEDSLPTDVPYHSDHVGFFQAPALTISLFHVTAFFSFSFFFFVCLFWQKTCWFYFHYFIIWSLLIFFFSVCLLVLTKTMPVLFSLHHHLIFFSTCQSIWHCQRSLSKSRYHQDDQQADRSRGWQWRWCRQPAGRRREGKRHRGTAWNGAGNLWTISHGAAASPRSPPCLGASVGRGRESPGKRKRAVHHFAEWSGHDSHPPQALWPGSGPSEQGNRYCHQSQVLSVADAIL